MSNSTNKSTLYDAEPNRDPLTGEPGAHPLGTGIGAVLGGAAAGAMTGTVAGPVGTLIGAAAGAVLGGLAGKSVAETVDPTAEDAYWQNNYKEQPYVDRALAYDDYRPAYGYGVDAFTRYPGRSFDELEADLASGWGSARGRSSLDWQSARGASRDAWQRVSDSTGRSVRGAS